MAKTMTVLAIAMLLSLGVIFTRSSAQQESKSAQHKLKKDKKDVARWVYKGEGHGPKLPESGTGRIYEVGLPSLDPFGLPTTLHDWLREKGCEADAVVIGTVKSSDSFLTEDETSIYTNHKFAVEEVLKDNPASPLHTDATVIVTRVGGTITLKGKRVSIVHKAALPFQVNKQYLLFLIYSPERESYVTHNPNYLLENGKTIKTTEAPERQEADAAILIQTTRNAMSSPCPGTEGGPQ